VTYEEDHCRHGWRFGHLRNRQRPEHFDSIAIDSIALDSPDVESIDQLAIQHEQSTKFNHVEHSSQQIHGLPDRGCDQRLQTDAIEREWRCSPFRDELHRDGGPKEFENEPRFEREQASGDHDDNNRRQFTERGRSRNGRHGWGEFTCRSVGNRNRNT